MIVHEPTPTQVPRPRLGAHMSITGGLPRAIDRGLATGCEALQIFTKSSSQWRARPIPDAEIELFRTRVTETGIGPVMAHASYLINLASPDETLRKRSMTALADELYRADRLGLAGVVLHPGAYTSSTEQEGIQRIADSIGEVLTQRAERIRSEDGAAELWLEHTAGQGTVLGHRFEQLRSMLDGIGDAHAVGICLDTCHLVGAGYDIISDHGYRCVFDEFERVIGFDRLKAVHLNDSKKPLGSRLDRHETIGQGCIGVEPFRRLLQDQRFAALPMVLETPKSKRSAGPSVDADPMDLQNLALLRDLMDPGRPPQTPQLRT